MHDDRIQCARCGIVFPRRHRTGRRPIYCSHTCRQRAYEARRRAAYHHHLGTPAPPRPTNPFTTFYEAGRRGGIRHALRPDQPVNLDRRRQTLCGTHVWTLSRHRFGVANPPLGRDCRTCSAIAAAYPLTRPVDPSPDLAEIKHVLLGFKAAFTHRRDGKALRHALEHLYSTALGPDPTPPNPVRPETAAA
jgi:hypothetical protein